MSAPDPRSQLRGDLAYFTQLNNPTGGYMGDHDLADYLHDLGYRRTAHNEGITEPRSAVRWEYGIMRDQASPKSSRKAAEEEIKRQRTRKGVYRITGQRLVRRLVGDWEEVESDG